MSVPDRMVAEILDGELYVNPRPAPRDADASSGLGGALTASIDRVQKFRIYAREHVGHVWLVDPLAKTLEVLRLENGRWSIVSTVAGPDVVRAEPFDALELDLSLLWE